MSKNRVVPDRIISQAKASDQAFSRLNEQGQKKLLANIAQPPRPGKGQGGKGVGGGKGDGVGTGEGDGTGPGKGGKIDIRQKRVLRWRMMFNTLNGDDYRRQLASLGAILAIPNPQGGYLVMEDLTPPVRPQPGDLSKITRIFWVDDTPQSVQSLSSALRLPATPPHIVAFFPETLEEELLRKEKAYRGKEEGDITETRFEIVQRAGGKYEPVVKGQK